MVVVAVVCAVVALVCLIWGVTRARAASSSAVRAAALEERAQTLDAELSAAHDKTTALEREVQQANERADQQTQKARESADEARRSDEMAEDAVQRAIRAETEASEARTALDAAEQERRAALADRDAVIAGTGPLHPEALWALEQRRIERLWKDRLALQPDEPSPVSQAPEDLGAILRVLAEASREESGVVIEVAWNVTEPIRVDRRVQLARIGEELVAAMRDSEGGELEVAPGPDGRIDLVLRSSPPVELPPSLTEALALLEIETSTDDGAVVVAVPPRGGAADVDLSAGEPEDAAAPTGDGEAAGVAEAAR